MLAQYLRVKAQHRDAILLFRLGDFYEMFFEDAERAVRDPRHHADGAQPRRPGRVPLCGFPVARRRSGYVTRLLAAGHARWRSASRARIPAAPRGSLEREVVRVITPGTILEEENLDPRRAELCWPR